jgi:hypothetical protein
MAPSTLALLFVSALIASLLGQVLARVAQYAPRRRAPQRRARALRRDDPADAHQKAADYTLAKARFGLLSPRSPPRC